jgi:tetratricopeptide (TPR) repeat protein
MPGNRQVFSEAIDAADHHRWEGKWSEAMRAYSQALAEFPEDVTARGGLGFCYMQTKQWPQALNEYEYVLQSESSNIIALSKTAELYGILNRREDAYTAYLHLAELYSQAGQGARAEAAWQKAIQLSPSKPEPHERLAGYYFEKKDIHLMIQQRLAAAQGYLLRGEPGPARVQCEEVLRADATNTDAQHLLIQIMGEARYASNVLYEASEVAFKASMEYDGHVVPGEEQNISGPSAFSEDPINETTSGNTSGGNTGIMGNMGSAGNYGGVNNPGPSVAGGGMNAAPRNRINASQVTGVLKQAQMFQTQGRFNDAIDLCEQILESGFDRPDARYFLGWLYQEQQRWEEAIQQFQFLLQDPEYALSCYYALGQCFRAGGDLRTATVHFDEAVDRVNLDALTVEESDQLVQLCQEAAEAHRLLGEQEQALTVYNALLGFLRSRGWNDKVAQVEFMLQQAQSAPAPGPVPNRVNTPPVVQRPDQMSQMPPGMQQSSIAEAATMAFSAQSMPPAPPPSVPNTNSSVGELPDWLTGILSDSDKTKVANNKPTPPPAQNMPFPEQAAIEQAQTMMFNPVAPPPIQPPAPPVQPPPAQPAQPAWLVEEVNKVGTTQSLSPEQLAAMMAEQTMLARPQAPVQQAPAQPVQQAPAQPVQQAPVQPVQQAPVQPVPQAPVQQSPVQQAPAQPVQQAPVAPMQQAPVQPVQPVPQAPVQQSPVAPVQQSPVQPVPPPVAPVQQASAQVPVLPPELGYPSVPATPRQVPETRAGIEDLLSQMAGGRDDGLRQAADAVLASTASLPETIRPQVIRSMQDIQKYIDHGLLTSATEECLRVIDIAPQYLDVHQILCEIYVRQGKVEQAITKYAILVDTYIVNGRIDDAIATYRRILQLEPNNLTYRMRLINLLSTQGDKEDLLRERTLGAEAYLRLGYMDRALTELEQALQESPTSVPTRLNYALALQKLGRTQQAVAEYQRVLQVDPRNLTALVRWHVAMITGVSASRGTTLEVLSRIRWQLRGEGQKHADAVIREYAQAAEIYPNNADVHFSLALIYHQAGMFDRAIDAYLQAMRDSAVEVLARVGAAQSFLSQGKPEAAIQQFEHALQVVRRSPASIDPTIWAARPREEGEEHQAPEGEISLLLAKAYGRTGRQDQMQAIMRQVKQNRPEQNEISSTLAEISSRQHDVDGTLREYSDLVRHYRSSRQIDNAINVLNEMVRMAPQDPRAHNELADIYIARGLLDEGIAELRLLAEIYLRLNKLEDAGDAIQRIGTVYSDMGDYEEALTNLCRAADLKPEAMDLFREIVGFCLQLGKNQEGARYQSIMARHYFDTQQIKEAVAALQQLITIDRNNFEAYDMLGQTYQSVGEYEQASRVYRNLAKVNPGSSVARDRLMMLQELRTR